MSGIFTEMEMFYSEKFSENTEIVLCKGWRLEEVLDFRFGGRILSGKSQHELSRVGRIQHEACRMVRNPPG